MSQTPQLDIIDMPADALAAYWLSLKKLADAKKSRTALLEEAKHTEEPFIRHVLETVFSDLEIAVVRKLVEARQESVLFDCRRRLDLMRLALYAIAGGENPRVTLVRMNSLFAEPPMEERQAFEMASGMSQALADPATDRAALLEINLKMPPDRLLVKLLFYAIHARRLDKQSLEEFLPYAGLPFFAEGLSLCVDGFEPDFLAYHKESIRDAFLRRVRRKMEMSAEMAISIRKKHTYEDVYLVARSYLG